MSADKSYIWMDAGESFYRLTSFHTWAQKCTVNTCCPMSVNTTNLLGMCKIPRLGGFPNQMSWMDTAVFDARGASFSLFVHFKGACLLSSDLIRFMDGELFRALEIQSYVVVCLVRAKYSQAWGYQTCFPRGFKVLTICNNLEVHVPDSSMFQWPSVMQPVFQSQGEGDVGWKSICSDISKVALVITRIDVGYHLPPLILSNKSIHFRTVDLVVFFF